MNAGLFGSGEKVQDKSMLQQRFAATQSHATLHDLQAVLVLFDYLRGARDCVTRGVGDGPQRGQRLGDAGVSGRERVVLDTPSGLTFPAEASGSTVGMLFSMNWIWPVTTSVTAAGEPLYGT